MFACPGQVAWTLPLEEDELEDEELELDELEELLELEELELLELEELLDELLEDAAGAAPQPQRDNTPKNAKPANDALIVLCFIIFYL